MDAGSGVGAKAVARRVAKLDCRVAAHRDTALFFGCPDVDAFHAHLRTAGLHLEPPKVAPDGMKQLWLEDPDGYELCFQWPAA
jgi:glyoxylase I family protein